jgi:threonine synthase
MKFYSTRNSNVSFTLREAVIHGLAPDGGLFMPATIPVLPASFIRELSKYDQQTIAYEIALSFLKEDFSPSEIHDLVAHTVSFPVPLVQIHDTVFSLELFHGPTLAFKDFGARFLSGLLSKFAETNDQETTVLVATSGDTGSAVAHGFYNVPGTRVVVLYPSGKVSELQEKQFTTLGGNIMALEVDGTFDDCQRLVKQAFADENLRRGLSLTSANSINIARLLPQSFYYLFGAAQAPRHLPLIYSVPSGNFGNLTAGVLAQRMGLPIHQFLAATNRNDVVPSYLKTGLFQPRPSLTTISNAMDVGNPSNFDRLVNLFDSWEGMTNKIKGYAYSDEETKQILLAIFEQHRYILDPHGAVGYLAVREYQKSNPSSTYIFLETAHPAKFKEVVEAQIGSIEIPSRLQELSDRQKKSIKIPADYDVFRQWLA